MFITNVLQDAQQSLSQANKDADALRKTTLEQEQRLSSLKDDLYHVKKEYDTLQAKYTGLGTEVGSSTHSLFIILLCYLILFLLFLVILNAIFSYLVIINLDKLYFTKYYVIVNK